MSQPRIGVALIGVLATSVALSGCAANAPTAGSSPSSSESTPAASAFNDPDIAFAMQMIPHHQQAVTMAQMILGKDGIDPRVTELATTIEAAQDPEVTLMMSWLDGWGSPYDDMGGMDMGMDGMMSDADMAALDAATGADATTLFLQQMITHHQGAIDMARVELQTGQNVDALALAQKIIDAQTAEITLMNELLN